MWVTLVRPHGLGGPDVSGDVCALGDGDAFDSVGPEEHERRRTPLCDLTEENTFTKQASLKQTGALIYETFLSKMEQQLNIIQSASLPNKQKIKMASKKIHENIQYINVDIPASSDTNNMKTTN